MQRYDRTHLIPIEDRKRELIAARHSARVRRLYGTIQGKQPASGVPAVLPVYMSADEVIGLIAYDRSTALSEPAPGAPPIFERWHSHLTGGSVDERQYPLVRDMRLVLARVRWWHLRKRKRAGPTECPTKPLDRIARGHVRWAIRGKERTAIETIALLRTDVRQLLAAQTAHEIAIERATAILCTEIAAEHIVAWGRPGVWRTRRFKGGIHEAIPPVFFANPQNSIIADGWATCGWDTDTTAQDWADWKGPEWGDVRFKRDDALSLIQRLFGPTTMQIDGGYISPLFITDEQNRVAELIEPHILIYENTLPDSRRMLSILETIVQTGRPFLFIGEDIDRSLLRTLVLNKQRGGMQIAAVRVRGDHERRKMVLEEVAAFTGGLVLNDDLGIEIEQITYREIGTARKVLIEKNRTTIFQGGGRTVSRRDPVPVATDESELQDSRRSGGPAAATSASGDWLTKEFTGDARAERSRRKPAGVNYGSSDAPLVDRMRQLLLTKRARNPWDAALAVSGQAEGHGKPESKAKRLVQRYSAVFGTERDGED